MRCMRTRIDRRTFALAAASTLVLPHPARATRQVTDSAGRKVELPDRIGRVFAAGGPASVAVYVLKPDGMVGWPREMRDEEKPYVLPGVRDLPRDIYVSLADSVQSRTGIPYVLIDGRFQATAASLRLLGGMLGVPERGETLARYTDDLFARLSAAVDTIPEAQRPRVYLARGPDGLETGLRGSINTEIIERAGGHNVADGGDQRRGIANVSREQLLLWNPDIVVTWDRNFFDAVTQRPDPIWQSVKAVAAKRVYLAPTAPFGWIDRPPSLNRLIGLAWLANIFHGPRFAFDIARDTRAFYKLFYGVDVSDADLGTLIAWADGKPPGMAARR